MKKRYPLGVLLLLVAALVLVAALATSAIALPKFTEGSGATPACETCHTMSQVHGVTAHANMVDPTKNLCDSCHTVNTLTPPAPSACGKCHGGLNHIVVEPTHSTIGCTTCHQAPAGPVITSITPAHALAGESVTIAGTGFGATQGAGTVKFGTTAATVTSWSDTSIAATVPALSPGAVDVTVTPDGGTASEAFSFTVDAPPVAPVVTSFTPTSAAEGALVSVTGTGFTGATAVTFNGTAATAFTVVSDTEISATVPTGATTGPIAVTTPAGTGTSATDFTIVPAAAPTIASFAPTSGAVGATVTLTGTGFTGATGVTFNGVAATIFTVVNDAQMTAKVPTGATTGAIAVTTPLGTGTSTTNFTVLKATTKISIKLSGLTLGVLKRGRAVTATGRVTPLRTGKVTITLQKKKAGKWVRIRPLVARTMSATGTYKWVYRAGTALSARGYYRVHTTTAKTAKYKAGLSVWKNFRVR